VRDEVDRDEAGDEDTRHVRSVYPLTGDLQPDTLVAE
jgi:hypothetical protein